MCQHCKPTSVRARPAHTSCASSPRVPTGTTAGRTQRHSVCVDCGCHGPGTITGPGVPCARPPQWGPGTCVFLKHLGASGAGRRTTRLQVFVSRAQIPPSQRSGAMTVQEAGRACAQSQRLARILGGEEAEQGTPPTPNCGSLEWGIEAGQRPRGCRHPLVFAPPMSSAGLTHSFRTSPGQNHGGHRWNRWESGPIALTAPSRRSWADSRAVRFQSFSSPSGMIF